MSEVEAKLERTAGIEVTTEEVRWRMEKVTAVVLSGQDTFEGAARSFNKALTILGGQGEGREAGD